MKSIKLFSLVIVTLILVYSCQDNAVIEGVHSPELPETSYDYMSVNDAVRDFSMPQTISITNGDEINTNDNSVRLDGSTTGMRITSDEIVTLGRVLFYDNRLSKNNSISCAGCHNQSFGFADGQAKSQGFGGEMTLRNSMSIANPIAKRNFFWDGRAGSLGDLALQPIFNHVEMGIASSEELLDKIRKEDYYQELFEDAFGDNEDFEGTELISRETVQGALAQFVGSIFKNDSKFDVGLETNFNDFSELEKHGMALFFSDVTNCSSCHNGVNFASPTKNSNNPYMVTAGTTNIGLELEYQDQGFASGKFSIPSLRNVALTAPYMHDGRFESLREVLEHYNDGIRNHKDLDSKLIRNGLPVKMELTDLDLRAMEAFLHTLTSATITSDVKYSNPF